MGGGDDAEGGALVAKAAQESHIAAVVREESTRLHPAPASPASPERRHVCAGKLQRVLVDLRVARNHLDVFAIVFESLGGDDASVRMSDFYRHRRADTRVANIHPKEVALDVGDAGRPDADALEIEEGRRRDERRCGLGRGRRCGRGRICLTVILVPRDRVAIRREHVDVAVPVDVGREDGVGVLVIIAPDDLYFENLERG